jgi:hypothetical protein
MLQANKSIGGISAFTDTTAAPPEPNQTVEAIKRFQATTFSKVVNIIVFCWLALNDH